MASTASRRLHRLAEELDEAGLDLAQLADAGTDTDLLVEEVDHAMRPAVHERRVPSSGTILSPTTDPVTWEPGTALEITHALVGDQPLDAARRFADGLSCWLVRRPERKAEWLIFDRPAGSERDLGVIARVMGATIVQRHPSGPVRVVGDFGVLRWNGFFWHHEPPVSHWINLMSACCAPDDVGLFQTLLEFAVHDLGAGGIGALLVYRDHRSSGQSTSGQDSSGQDSSGQSTSGQGSSDQGSSDQDANSTGADGTGVEHRLPTPPPLRIDHPIHLAPLRHALTQIDGAAVFDREGVLRQLGVRLVPSLAAENGVVGYKGTRHTSGRRYSYDYPNAIIIAVSEDGPVSVFHKGEILGRSQPASAE